MCKRNIEAPLRKNFCRTRAISNANSEFVFVAVVIQVTKRGAVLYCQLGLTGCIIFSALS
jgi:hypothetical protein